MQEKLLHFIWQYQLIAPGALRTTDGDVLRVVRPGQYNHNAGPDFLNAHVIVGNTKWFGHVEIHVNADDWFHHQHHNDPNYNSVILHVVYENNQHKKLNFPTLELKEFMQNKVVLNYQQLTGTNKPIPCQNSAKVVSSLIWTSWYERLLANRWDNKINELIKLNNSDNDWRQIFYTALASNFGFGVNNEAFLNLAVSLPLNLLSKHKHNKLQLESLLYGQAGFLENMEIKDEYSNKLLKEYQFLKLKYNLKAIPFLQWKTMRLRPGNFPTIRIAQFAQLIYQSQNLFQNIIKITDLKKLKEHFELQASKYWDNHYLFGVPSEYAQSKKLGHQSIESIAINTIAPMQYFYAKSMNKPALLTRCINLLTSIKAENNLVIRKWKLAAIIPENAFESQALLELYKNYCTKKLCLNCKIGAQILRI